MKKLIGLLVCTMLFLNFSPHVLAEEENTGNYIIYYENASVINKEMIVENGGKVLFAYENIPALLVNVSHTLVSELEALEYVKYVEEDTTTTATLPLPVKTPRLFNHYTQMVPWGVERVAADEAWKNGYTGKGVKVAVLDTGISTNHEDLTVAGGASFLPYTYSYDDDHGHGTHVAGIIAAENNSVGIVGVAPNVHLYAVKVIDYNNIFYTSNLIKGIDWSINNGMDIINLSLSTFDYVDNYALRNIIQVAYDNGLTIVGAAGNTGEDYRNDTINYPAKYPQVISVSATDIFDERPLFSSFGMRNDIAAPGDYIFSTLPYNSYGTMSGTSMAAPHVAGVLALVKEKYPTYTNAQLKEALVDNAYDLGARGWDRFFGFGLVQADFLTKKTIQVTDIAINQKQVLLSPGENATLMATITPLNATNPTVLWYSSNSSIVSVNQKGDIQAHKPGTVTLYAITEDGGYEATSIVTVEGNDSSYKVWESQENVAHDKEWKITFNQVVDVATNDMIYVTDSTNRVIPVQHEIVRNEADDTSTVIVTPLEIYESNQDYTLWIEDVRSVDGKLLNENVKMNFRIQ